MSKIQQVILSTYNNTFPCKLNRRIWSLKFWELKGYLLSLRCYLKIKKKIYLAEEGGEGIPPFPPLP